MYFLLRINPETPNEQLIPGDSFYYRPAPGNPLFASIWDVLVGHPTDWRYVSIPEDQLPIPSELSSLIIEDGILMINDRSYDILSISLRRFILYCCEAVVYLTFDESWFNPNWRLWHKTGGKGR